jgi:hypothetical protein
MNCIFSPTSVTVRLLSRIVHRPYGGKRACCRLLQLISGFALALALVVPGLLHAQTFYGSINGVIKDSSGAVMPGVAVTVRESTTSTEYKTVTNKSGSYRVSFLKPGS